MSRRGPPDPDEIRETVLLDTPVLDRLQDTALPFRGQRRQELLQRVRYQVKSRRTSGAVATRLANVTIGTITESIDSEARFVVEENVENFLEDRFGDIERPLQNND